jgi:CHC2 zinc finger
MATRSEWTNWIESARAANVLEVAQLVGAHLKRGGANEWIGPCPLCGGTDRFSVNVQKRVFNCRGAEGGDVIKMVMHIEGRDFLAAVERITGTVRPDRSRDETLEERERRERAYEQRQVKCERREEEEQRAETARAKRDEQAIDEVIDRAVPLQGTHGEAYLRARKLNPPRRLCGDLRFVSELDYWGQGNGSPEPIHLATLPALVAIIRDPAGAVIGISQTFLDPEEPKKWQPTGSHHNSQKKIRGRKQGGMIHLGPPEETIAIAEGWENALAWYQLGLGPEEVMLAAAVDLGNLAGRATGQIAHKTLVDPEGRPRRMPNGKPDPKAPGLILPQGIRSVIIIADTDSESYATAGLLAVAVRRFQAQELNVEISWPPTGKDYNQILLEESR